MNDLNTINRLNAEASEANVSQLLAAGKCVVVCYSGLQYVSHTSFDTAEAAGDEIVRLGNERIPGNRARLFTPSQPGTYTPSGDPEATLEPVITLGDVVPDGNPPSDLVPEPAVEPATV